jgi:single-stranded-DNA-specific exonuclease
MQDKKWCLAKTEPRLARELAQALGVSPLVGQLLINRGIKDAVQGTLFLQPALNGLNDPAQLNGINQALTRLNQALRQNEKILIYGDYDVDGITATVLLVNLFKLIDRSVSYYIPHRLEEGYSLNHQALDKFAREDVKLLITVDCGICDCEEIAYAKKLGMDIIITDHHEPREMLPQAEAVVNPKMSLSETAPVHPAFIDLAGVGVAFKLVWAFSQQFSPIKKNSKEFHDFLMDAMALVALGTIADVAPLVNENRIFVVYGLEALRYTRLKGLRVLLEQCGLGKRPLNAEDIAFRIAPRLNAAGRMNSARLSAELLLSSAESRIQEIVKELETANHERQRLEGKILQEARDKLLEEFDPEEEFMIVLTDKNWHPGVIGIVASRLAEEFYRPVALITSWNGRGRGSARSIPDFHLYGALAQCRDLFSSFGGHAAAAGFEIEPDLIPKLKMQLNAYLKQSIKPEDFVPSLLLDAEMPLTEITKKLVSDFNRLTPFGAGAPEPLLASTRVRVAGVPRLMGNKEEHLSFYVTQDKTVSFRVVAFKQAGLIEKLTRTTKSNQSFSIAYTPRINVWEGQESIELLLKDIHFESR